MLLMIKKLAIINDFDWVISIYWNCKSFFKISDFYLELEKKRDFFYIKKFWSEKFNRLIVSRKF